MTDAIAINTAQALRKHLNGLDLNGHDAPAAWVHELDALIQRLQDGWRSGSTGLGEVIEERSDSPTADYLLDAADALYQSARGSGPRRRLDMARLRALRALLEESA